MTNTHPAESIGARGTVVAVITSADGSKRYWHSSNRIAHAGSRHYAQRAARETPSEFVDGGGVQNLAMVLWENTTFGTAGNPFQNLNLQDGGVIAAWNAAAPYTTTSKINIDSGYPKTDDNDVDNTGSGPLVLTYRGTYGSSAAVSANIRGVALVNQSFSLSSWSLGQLFFSGAWLSGGSAIEKISGETLKVFVNHSINLG